jgi:hypothetical protein
VRHLSPLLFRTACIISVGYISAIAGCSSSEGQSTQPLTNAPTETKTGTLALFEVPEQPSALASGCSVDGGFSSKNEVCYPAFWDHPWPSDFRRTADGHLEVSGYPNPNSIVILDSYIEVIKKVLDGFSPQSSGFLRFSATIDTNDLPATPPDSIKTTSKVQLIDVDPKSPELGQRKLIELYYRQDEGVYWTPNTLSFRPAYGFPLRPSTQYALVVTKELRDKQGKAIQPSDALDQILGNSPATGARSTLKAAWDPALDQLEKVGISRKDIGHLTVFTTSDPTKELQAIRDDVRANQPAPKALTDNWKQSTQSASYDVYEGRYGPTPDYQAGTVPFAKTEDGGNFVFENGKPKVQRMYDQRFALAVPLAKDCPMPANGYPIVMYAHGTTGNYRSFLGVTADSLAKRCMASMGVDQIFHGDRPGAPTGPNKDTTIEVLFFNFENPNAARTNARQSAIDEVQRARLFTESKMTVPGTVSRTQSEIKFDGSKVLFYGHSQGGLNGPLYMAVDDSTRGGVLSGSASIISITLLEKTEPAPSVANLVRTVFLGLRADEAEELNGFHPAISLAQSLIDPVDPIHYVGSIIKEPRPGFASKSILMTEGVNPDGSGDSYAPPRAIEAQAVAMGLPIQTPIIFPVPAMTYGPGQIDIPAGGTAGNLLGGKASGVLVQWRASDASDGHFVVSQIPAATAQAAEFCKNLTIDPIGKVPPR